MKYQQGVFVDIKKAVYLNGYLMKPITAESIITPKTIQKKVRDLISVTKTCDDIQYGIQKDYESMNNKELDKIEKELEKMMRQAALELNFEEAAVFRDRLSELRKFRK